MIRQLIAVCHLAIGEGLGVATLVVADGVWPKAVVVTCATGMSLGYLLLVGGVEWLRATRRHDLSDPLAGRTPADETWALAKSLGISTTDLVPVDELAARRNGRSR